MDIISSFKILLNILVNLQKTNTNPFFIVEKAKPFTCPRATSYVALSKGTVPWNKKVKHLGVILDTK